MVKLILVGMCRFQNTFLFDSLRAQYCSLYCPLEAYCVLVCGNRMGNRMGMKMIHV